MRQSLSLRFGQQMTMTPQLQQAIRLMQLSAMELNLEIREAVETNPMLELEDDVGDVSAEDLGSDPEWEDRDEPTSEMDDEGDDFIEDVGIPEELPVDTSWDDVYQASAPTGPPALDSMEFDNPASESLIDHLLWQLNLAPMTPRDRLIGAAIIEAIDADGMLQVDVEEIAESLAGAFSQPNISATEVESVLTRVQQFEPVGVGARDLRECLLLQLDQLPPDTASRDDAIRLIEHHFDLLAGGDFNALTRASRLDLESLKQAMELVRSLSPRPGAAVGDFDCEYIEPDVFVSKVVNGDKGRWLVELNADAVPKLRINDDYAGLVRRGDSSADNAFLRNNLQDARWFLKSLRKPQRNAAYRGHGNRRAPAGFPRPRRRGDETPRTRRHRRRRWHARVDYFARHDAQIHADAARSLRAEVLLLKPCRHGNRRRSIEYRHPRTDQESRRRREPESALERQPDRVHARGT